LIKEQGARVSGFVDDITVYIEGEKAENASRLSSILKTSEIIIASVVNWKQLSTSSRSVLCILQSETT
jgi:hypothetical protein